MTAFCGFSMFSVPLIILAAAQPSFWRFLADILRFNKITRDHLAKGGLAGMTLGEYLIKHRFNQKFINQYIIPMGAAIWSTPDEQMMEFPAQTFARFFENHGLLAVSDERDLGARRRPLCDGRGDRP